MYRKNKAKGFSLVELMIVVAVIVILAGIGLPMYQGYVQKVRRVDATSVLTEAAQFMERYYTTNHRYDQDLGGTAVAIPADLDESPKESGVKFYDIAIDGGSLGPNTYTLIATPKGPQAGNGIVTLTNTGAKGWDKDNDGNIEAGETCWLKKCS